MTSYWNDHIMSEMVYHLSAKQGLEKDRTTDLWAISEGNSRGLKQAQKCFYNASDPDEAMDTLKESVDEALRDYNKGERIIESQDDHLSKLLTEGYVQGILRAWVLVTDGPDTCGDEEQTHEPPQDLSALRHKDIPEVK